MNRFPILFLILLFSLSCSLDTKSNLWKDETEEKVSQTKEIFETTTIIKTEFNQNIKINLKESFNSKNPTQNINNNKGYLNFDSNLKKLANFNFSKVKNFENRNQELVFTDNNQIIFAEDKGSIIKINSEFKKIWKVNHYSKSEKKSNPTLFFGIYNNKLIVADTISKIYSIDLKSGNLIWKKNSSAPFNSQIKILKDRFYVVDLKNVLRCYSIKDGSEIWNFKSESTFINSPRKLSLIIDDEKVIFINSLGDITAVDAQKGSLLWQTPTQRNSLIEDAFSLKNSDLVLSKKRIFFSNNKNEFFSIDSTNGLIRWKQNIKSDLSPSIIGNLIFTITNDGFLVIIDADNGNIIRITYIFDKLKDKKIKAEGFFVGKNFVYTNINNGQILKTKISDGRSIDFYKLGGGRYLKSYINNKNLFVLKSNSLLKLN